MHRRSVWLAALWLTGCAVAVLYVIIGERADGNQRPDAAYYFGVARHIATTGSFEEPIVWHFLAPPETIVHPPFDYWAPLTSLTLVPLLRIFGATHEVALLAMASIAALSVLAFAYLVSVTLRHAPVQLLALLAFAFAPAAASYRFDTESIGLFHLILVLALIAYVREWDVAALVCSFLLLLTRSGAGSIFCAILWGACLFRARGRRRWTLGLTAGALACGYLLFNLVLFGGPLPPAARLAPLVRDQLDLLSYGVEPGPAPANLIAAARLFAEALLETDFVPLQPLWLLLALLSATLRSPRRGGLDALVWLLLFPGGFLIVVATHAMYSERIPLLLLPLVVLGGACGLDSLLERVPLRRRWPRWLVTAGLVAFGCACLLGLRGYRERGPAWLGTRSLSHLGETLRGEAVASELPYFVIAETASPAVSLPLNGEQAIDAVLRRYDVRWLLLFGTDFGSPDYPTETLVQEILDGRRTRLGSFELQHVRTRPREWVLFRLAPTRR